MDGKVGTDRCSKMFKNFNVLYLTVLKKELQSIGIATRLLRGNGTRLFLEEKQNKLLNAMMSIFKANGRRIFMTSN